MEQEALKKIKNEVDQIFKKENKKGT